MSSPSNPVPLADIRAKANALKLLCDKAIVMINNRGDVDMEEGFKVIFNEGSIPTVDLWRSHWEPFHHALIFFSTQAYPGFWNSAMSHFAHMNEVSYVLFFAVGLPAT